MLYILSGSSGAGKNTIINQLILQNDSVKIMKSCTTRQPRNDQEKNSYFFLSEKEFVEKIENDEFFEYEQVHKGIFYGVLKKSIEIIKNNQVYLKDIDVLGAMNIKKIVGDEFVKLIYLDVPKEELEKRILLRGESEESAKARLSRYDFEKNFADKYDLIIKNQNQENTIERIIEFIKLTKNI